eukprot:CAMPEP_0202077918 /NCGR_PEP_ID=MMETSP0964-20121228/5639_1 /ASSEMBLY_ACC=CAM_ASM_000500 /TAXON_ID=4773 /ORGANISM="Schizochytrium aggregatum, Strain ATCC28209" /LENGTH=136 /DNA_ID=CAMNT_0048645207 /DNA_START=54 /DNA_END=461 /DNA_ORIENTATION=+
MARDKKDPELWDAEHRKMNCEIMLEQFVSLEWVSRREMSLVVNGRFGMPAPALLTTGAGRSRQTGAKSRRTSASVLMLEAMHGGAPGRLRTSVAGMAFNNKMPLRDIGKGNLIFRRLVAVSQVQVLCSCYFRRSAL